MAAVGVRGCGAGRQSFVRTHLKNAFGLLTADFCKTSFSGLYVSPIHIVPAAEVLRRNPLVLACKAIFEMGSVPQWDGYDFPGGGADLGETIDEAFRREIREETGLVAERGDVLLCESDFFIHPSDKKPYHTMLAYYLCKSVSGEITDANFVGLERQYAKKAEWVERSKVKDLKFYNPIDSPALIEKAFKMQADHGL